jgi:pimeloyl-ACP methyl ester carboxylesterase
LNKPEKNFSFPVCLAALLLSFSTASAGPAAADDGTPSARDYYPAISFLYGTDREFKEDGYTANQIPTLDFGEAQMILHLHYFRHSDALCDWWRLRDPAEKKTGLLPPAPLDPASFVASLNSRAHQETFIYVHGFSTTFEEGALEASQIAYDLQLPGTPLLYSWPSHGAISLADYKTDQAMVNRPETIGHLTAFIVRVLESSPHSRMNLVGFSMGAYLLTRALMEMVDQGRDLSQIGTVILISADIDTEDFKNIYYPKLRKALGGRLVLYVSGRDQALVLSSAFHQGKPRLGQGGEKVTTLPGVATIDATQSSFDCGICHGLSQINGVINDMYLSLHQGLPLNKRLMDEYEKNGGKYYVLFDDSHEIVTIQDHNFAVAGQLGTYLNTFKLIWLPDPALEIGTGTDRGYLPRQIEFRWNLQSKNFRPYLDAGLNDFDQGSGETAWAAHEGLGAEYAFDSGLGLGLEWDYVSQLTRSPSVSSGSTLDALLKNNNFPWSGFRLQLIQYFDFNKLLD